MYLVSLQHWLWPRATWWGPPLWCWVRQRPTIVVHTPFIHRRLVNDHDRQQATAAAGHTRIHFPSAMLSGVRLIYKPLNMMTYIKDYCDYGKLTLDFTHTHTCSFHFFIYLFIFSLFLGQGPPAILLWTPVENPWLIWLLYNCFSDDVFLSRVRL